MFTAKPNYHKLRTNLKLCINRLKLLEKKKTEQALKARKEIADYIAIGKDDRARIRVEHIIREDYMVEAMEIIEMLCDLILARFGLIEKMTELDPGLESAIATIIWVTPRLSGEILELKDVTIQFVTKYGKEFGDMCRQNGFHNVHEKVIYKMNIASPPRKLVENYMIEIAKTFKISYVPDPLDLQDDIPNSEDLLDLNIDTMPNNMPSSNQPVNQFLNNTKQLEAYGYDGNHLNYGFSGVINSSEQPYDNTIKQNNDIFQGVTSQGNQMPPSIPTTPPNASHNKTLTSQITWDNEELPQLPPYESVVRQPFNYPTFPTGQNSGTNQSNYHPNNLPNYQSNFGDMNNQPFSNNNMSYPPPLLNVSQNQDCNIPFAASRLDKIGGVAVFPKLPDLPGLPSVPTDSINPASNEDIDFDDLTRRFEELKKKK